MKIPITATQRLQLQRVLQSGTGPCNFGTGLYHNNEPKRASNTFCTQKTALNERLLKICESICMHTPAGMAFHADRHGVCSEIYRLSPILMSQSLPTVYDPSTNMAKQRVSLQTHRSYVGLQQIKEASKLYSLGIFCKAAKNTHFWILQFCFCCLEQRAVCSHPVKPSHSLLS